MHFARTAYVYDFALSLVFASVIVAVFYFARRRRQVDYVIIAFLLVCLAAFFSNRDVIVNTYHGFWHASIVYDILEKGAPPEASLYAGVPLKYPYALHLLFAELMKFIPASPLAFFNVLAGICVVLFVIIVDRIARTISTDPTFRCLAIFAVLFGFGFIQTEPVHSLFRAAGVSIGETRLGPSAKFLGVGAFYLGITMNALVVLGLVRIVAGRGGRFGSLAMVGAGLLCGGLAYAPTLPPSALWVAVALGQLFFIERPRQWRVIVALAGVSAAACLAILPYLLAIAGGKAETAALHFPSTARLLPNLRTAIVLLALPAAILFLSRHVLLDYVRRCRPVLTFLLLALAVTVPAFLVSSWASMNQYKLLVASELLLGIVIAGPLTAMLASRPKITQCLMVLMALPFAYRITTAVIFTPAAADPVVASGRDLVHQDPEQRALYVWIEEHTPRDAVILDTYLTVPPLARRPLFIGLDTRRQNGELAGKRDGWFMSARSLQELVLGVEPAALDERTRIAETVLRGGEEKLDDATLDALFRQTGNRPVYVVARDGAVRQRLTGNQRFDVVFQNPAAAVFRVSDRGKLAAAQEMPESCAHVAHNRPYPLCLDGEIIMSLAAVPVDFLGDAK